MDFLSYKTYVWPRNPEVYREELLREPKYSTDNGLVLFEGMGELKRIITGNGVFYGEKAVEDFQLLAELLEDEEPGDLKHPLWGNRYCYFTGLELTQEPKDNCVSYRFQFTGADANGSVPK